MKHWRTWRNASIRVRANWLDSRHTIMWAPTDEHGRGRHANWRPTIFTVAHARHLPKVALRLVDEWIENTADEWVQ